MGTLLGDGRLVIAIDFDGTIAEAKWPDIGSIRDGAVEIINKLYDEGHKVIINTCRTGAYEGNAKKFLDDNGIKYNYINSNLPYLIKYFEADCRKISADVYIDDKCLFDLPDWYKIYDIIQLKFFV